MIFFCRKMPQKLLQNLPAGKVGNRHTKYFPYAVSEIFVAGT
jgi:hypothetical protein